MNCVLLVRNQGKLLTKCFRLFAKIKLFKIYEEVKIYMVSPKSFGKKLLALFLAVLRLSLFLGAITAMLQLTGLSRRRPRVTLSVGRVTDDQNCCQLIILRYLSWRKFAVALTFTRVLPLD
jgi:hypothetical protein